MDEKEKLLRYIQELTIRIQSLKARVNKLKEYGFLKTVSGIIASFTHGADNVPVSDLLVGITPKQSGSGDPSPTNIRPISGTDEVMVVRAGKNLCGDVAVPTSLDMTNRVVNPIYLKAGTYTISISGRSSVTAIYVRKGASVTFAGDYFAIKYNTNSLTFTADEDGYYYFQFYRHNTTATWEEEPITHAWLELGSTATTYEPYAGTTYTTALGQTVYGGTLDVVSGVLTNTHGYIASYNGETLPGTWISDRDVYAEGTAPTIGAEVVYELSTPITYQLTPTEVRTLLGDNNIWADTGSVKVTYRAVYTR